MWLWLIVAGIAIGVPVIVITAALLLRARAARATLRESGHLTGPARGHVTRVTRCGLVGLGVGALTALALVADYRRPGVLAVLACACGYLGGVLLGEYTGQPPARGPVRAARLQARRPTDYVPRWAAAAAALSAVLVLAAPIAFAVAPVIHYPGCPPGWHCVSSPGWVQRDQTAWPAWPGTVTAAAVVAAALVLGAAGLRRIAARPGPAGGSEQVDDVLRHQAGRAILGAVLGLEMLVLGYLLLTGSAGLAVPNAATAPGPYLGEQVMSYAGGGCAVVGLAAWLVLSGRIRRSAAPPPDQAAVTPGP